MRGILGRWIGSLFLLWALFVAPASSGEPLPIAAGEDRVAIQGYDTVAYFTDGKATKGSSEHSYEWADVTWWFASAAHREMFAADPESYMPQFGGFFSMDMRGGGMVPADPELWAIVDGKLYMVAGTRDDLATWQADAEQNIRFAEEQWPPAQSE